MKINKETPSWAWDYYQAYQTKASKSSDESNEEVLNFIIRLIGNDQLPLDEAELDRMVHNHLASHRQKLRRRASLYEKYATEPATADTVETATLRETIEAIHIALTGAQWVVLSEVAAGKSYKDVSGTASVPIGTVKSLVSRMRAKLRHLRAPVINPGPHSNN